MRNLNRWEQKIHVLLLVTTFLLIALGGAVRSMDAGLACPDWPLCFGQVVPKFQVQVYYEFIHRVIAGIVGLLTVWVVARVLLKRGNSPRARRVAFLAIIILGAQIILGALTVTMLLTPFIVTGHLMFGMSFFCSLLWLYFEIYRDEALAKYQLPGAFWGIFLFSTVALFGQIFLGGLVSTNYAGLVCPDWPLCGGQFIPTLAGEVGLHVMHRLGAYFVAITILAVARVVWKSRRQSWMNPKIPKICIWLTLLVLLQIVLGVSNVLFKIPPLITVLHLAVAASLLGLHLRILHLSLASQK